MLISIKQCEKRLPLKYERRFREISCLSLKYLKLISRTQILILRLLIQASESTQLRMTRFFFIHYYLATSTTD